ncbi:MAG: type ISP restriction/modification enzyme [Myxococcota bacterium]
MFSSEDLSPTPIEQRVLLEGAVRSKSLAKSGARRALGIVHTPLQIARFLIREADRRVQSEFSLPNGIASRGVGLIDPACGPGVFLAAALGWAGQRSSTPTAVFGLDVDADALQSAQDTLGPPLAQAGWPYRFDVRNTLDWEPDWAGAGVEQVAIVGNPPWAVRSRSRGVVLSDTWLEDFRRDAQGDRLREARLGVLSDDYVRFLRWGAEMVRRAPSGGVLAMVTNGSYLDGPVHRGMRRCLLEWFDRVDIVDLGGNARVASGAVRDENLFGASTSAACLIAVRSGRERRHSPGRRPLWSCNYRSVRGSRSAKLLALTESMPARQDSILEPTSPHYLLVPAGTSFPKGWIGLDDAIPFHREGVQTNRDGLAVADDLDQLRRQLTDYAHADSRAGDAAMAFPSTRHYDANRARIALRKCLEAEELPVRRIAYRPHINRWFVTAPWLCHRPRSSLLQAVDHSELVLLTVRKDRGDAPWNHFGSTTFAPDNCWLSSRSSCRTRAFPSHSPTGEPNLCFETLSAWWPLGSPQPAAFLHYALAILATESYRNVFDDALRRSYPCLPPPTSAAWFTSVAAVGARLHEAFCAVATSTSVLSKPSALRVDDPETWRIGHRHVTTETDGFREVYTEVQRIVGLEFDRMRKLES